MVNIRTTVLVLSKFNLNEKYLIFLMFTKYSLLTRETIIQMDEREWRKRRGCMTWGNTQSYAPERKYWELSILRGITELCIRRGKTLWRVSMDLESSGKEKCWLTGNLTSYANTHWYVWWKILEKFRLPLKFIIQFNWKVYYKILNKPFFC